MLQDVYEFIVQLLFSLQLRKIPVCNSIEERKVRGRILERGGLPVELSMVGLTADEVGGIQQFDQVWPCSERGLKGDVDRRRA